MNKKIVFFSGAMGRGGAERVISVLANYYVNNGYDVQIAMVLHSQVEYELDERIKVVDLSSPKGIKKGFFKTLKKIKKYVQEEKPAVVVSFMAQVCLLVGLSLKKSKIPVLMSERIDPSQVHRNFIYKKLLDRIYAKSNALVLQTQRAKSYFNNKIQEKSIIIANPIKVYETVTDNPNHEIVTAGRLTEQKNHKMLIKAFNNLENDFPDYTLKIFGEGPLREELEGLIKELEIEDKVFLPGNSPQLHKDISNSEIFVLTSNFEGLSNALLEAMMMGFPVISTTCAGSDEIIINGENGLLIPVGDQKALEDALRKLMSDNVLRNKLSNNAKESVECCKVENVISKWTEAIEGVIK